MCVLCDSAFLPSLTVADAAAPGLLAQAVGEQALSTDARSLLVSGDPGWNSSLGLGGVVTFSFAQTPEAGGPTGGFRPFTEAQAAAARQALAAWADASGLTFVEVPDRAGGTGVDIRFLVRDLVSGQDGLASFPDNGAISLAAANYGAGQSTAPGTYGYFVLLHEIGHALGLKHPHERTFGNFTTLTPAADNWHNTVMSYTHPGATPSGLGPLDAAAVAHVYGSQADQPAWATTARYDAGTDSVVVLGDGRSETIWGTVGRRTTAFAGEGNDTLLGDTGAEFLSGDGGNDSIRGGAGADTVLGGTGNDTLDGGDGRNLIDGGAGADRLTGGSDADTLLGGEGADTLTGNTFFFSGAGDRLLGGGGDDSITGGGGVDFLAGGTGDNTVTGSFGTDTLGLVAAFRSATLVRKTDSAFYSSSPLYDDTLFNGTASGAGETTTYSGIENFAFLDGRLVFAPSDPAMQVYRVYQAALGRAPDPIGLNDWIARIEAGTPLSAIAGGFLGAPEFTARYGVPNDAAFVTQTYQNVLGRSPDPFGGSYWNGRLAAGVSRADVIIGFSESTEFRATTATRLTNGLWDQDENAAAATRLYGATLGRRPDEAGLRVNDAALDNGLPLESLAEAFMVSPEFTGRYGNTTDTAFIGLLYRNVLGREADPAGFATWQRALDAGALDRGGVVLGFSESLENRIASQSHIEGGIVFA